MAQDFSVRFGALGNGAVNKGAYRILPGPPLFFQSVNFVHVLMDVIPVARCCNVA